MYDVDIKPLDVHHQVPETVRGTFDWNLNNCSICMWAQLFSGRLENLQQFAAHTKSLIRATGL